ncbi:S9 family peptidase [Agilicoccus flavus]|uniref:S9 family peptidase n=1 Tax=Agilicoccus flavus TaxID=2775968 RepID=UPI001CF64A0E|nr:S9 family peptidase [Agilicoccus flavus]
MRTPPVIPTRPQVRSHHGDDVLDPYAWLADADDPGVRAVVDAENAYAEEMTAHLRPLREAVYAEIGERTRQTDLSVPVADRGWWYFTRTVAGRQYPEHCRAPGVPGAGRPEPELGADPDTPPARLPGEQVLLDEEAEAQGHDYFALGGFAVDVAGERLAYLVDTAGDERFALRVRDIATGATLDDAVAGAGYGVVWSADGRYLFYVRPDEAWRPHEVWRHEVGTPANADELVHAEPDERFWLGIGSSRDERHLVVAMGSKSTSETWLGDLADPLAPLRLVAPRVDGVEYDVEPAGDVIFVVHNRDRADFDLAWAPIVATSSQDWRPVVAAGERERIVDVDAFATHAVVSLRSGGLPRLRVVPYAVRPSEQGGEGGATLETGPVLDVEVEEELFSISLAANPEWDTRRLLVELESFVTPRTILEYDLEGGVGPDAATVVRRQPVLGGYDPADYVQRREWVTAADGEAIPVSVVARADVPADGTAPGLLTGYGAYDIALDPYFSIPRLSLLDRGVVVAVAHVRGGGELGRAWYEGGRLEHKENSFTDLVACADHLVDTGLVAPDRLGVEGGSAGGLLVGAALNLAPHRFAVALAEVPFVDALTTILDPEAPLTVTEWEEWGDPLHDPAVYARMKGYTPYENVRAVDYPAILATTSLNDTRVSFAEPAKWVARLRETVTQDLARRPVLLRTDTVAGHGGVSGRYHAWRRYAWEMAFVLDRLGATAVLPAAGDAASTTET